MVVVRHFVATIAGDDIQIMMSFRPDLARTEQGTFKLIVRISNLIRTEHCLQAILVECFIVVQGQSMELCGQWVMADFLL